MPQTTIMSGRITRDCVVYVCILNILVKPIIWLFTRCNRLGSVGCIEVFGFSSFSYFVELASIFDIRGFVISTTNDGHIWQMMRICGYIIDFVIFFMIISY